MNDSSPGASPVGRIESRSVYRGNVLDVREDRVRYPDGSVGKLEVIRHPGAAAALPLYRPGEWDGGTAAAVVLLRQYRYMGGGTLWEIPAGKLDPGESPEACARRELEEEAGLVAGNLTPMTALLTTPGFTDEVIHLFAATGLRQGHADPEAHEFLECREIEFGAALEMVRRGEIVDAKTVTALLMASAFPELWASVPAAEVGNDLPGQGV